LVKRGGSHHGWGKSTSQMEKKKRKPLRNCQKLRAKESGGRKCNIPLTSVGGNAKEDNFCRNGIGLAKKKTDDFQKVERHDAPRPARGRRVGGRGKGGDTEDDATKKKTPGLKEGKFRGRNVQTRQYDWGEKVTVEKKVTESRNWQREKSLDQKNRS